MYGSDILHHSAVYVYVSELRHQRCSAPSHYLNQCWRVVYESLRIFFQLNLNQYLIIFFRESQFENAVRKMSALFA